MRLIDADAHECWACTHHATGECDTWCDNGESFCLREDVKNAPTIPIDTKLIKCGKWEYHLLPLAFKCSYCGYKQSAKVWKYHAKQYCPNCGARMEV